MGLFFILLILYSVGLQVVWQAKLTTSGYLMLFLAAGAMLSMLTCVFIKQRELEKKLDRLLEEKNTEPEQATLEPDKPEPDKPEGSERP